jgi:hypothetical protein
MNYQEEITKLACSKTDPDCVTYLRHSADGLRDKKDLIIAEIGVENGTNALRLLKILDIKHFYLVDWYKPQEQWGYSQTLVDQQRKHAHEILEPYKDRITWLEFDSHEAVNAIPELDYVYIDGDHTFQGVYRDIVDYFPKVKEGGIVGGHDFTSYEECRQGVIKYILENNLTCSFKFQDWWIQK